MGCCESKPDLRYVRPNSQLYRALHMTTTRNGEKIKATIFHSLKQITTESQREAIASNPNTSDDFKKIFSPPLCNLDELKKNFFYLTSVGGLTQENLTKFGITLIINATFEAPLIQTDTITSFRVPVDDDTNEDISIYFDEVVEKIKQCKQLGGKCVVHCMAGASRSTTLALAYIIKHERMNLKDAFASVRRRRECARPNIDFWEQLVAYELKSRKKNTVRIVTTKEQSIVVKYPDLYDEPENQDFKKRVIQTQIDKYNAVHGGLNKKPNYKMESK